MNETHVGYTWDTPVDPNGLKFMSYAVSNTETPPASTSSFKAPFPSACLSNIVSMPSSSPM